MKRVYSLFMAVLLLFLLPMGNVLAQDGNATEGSDSNAVYLLVIVGLIVIQQVRDWSKDRQFLKTLEAFNSNRDLIREAESRFDHAAAPTQLAIKALDSMLKFVEPLARVYFPNSQLADAVDEAEDFTNEITDGVPVDTKPVMSMKEAADILYKEGD